LQGIRRRQGENAPIFLLAIANYAKLFKKTNRKNIFHGEKTYPAQCNVMMELRAARSRAPEERACRERFLAEAWALSASELRPMAQT